MIQGILNDIKYVMSRVVNQQFSCQQLSSRSSGTASATNHSGTVLATANVMPAGRHTSCIAVSASSRLRPMSKETGEGMCCLSVGNDRYNTKTILSYF